MLRGEAEKRLDIQRIEEIKRATGFMTLHGGSGTSDEDFNRAIKAGMTFVRITQSCDWRGAQAWNRPWRAISTKSLTNPAGALQATKDVVKGDCS